PDVAWLAAPGDRHGAKDLQASAVKCSERLRPTAKRPHLAPDALARLGPIDAGVIALDPFAVGGVCVILRPRRRILLNRSQQQTRAQRRQPRFQSEVIVLI